MSDDVVIRVENLGKRYRIRHQKAERYTSLRDVIAQTAFESVKRLGSIFTKSTRNSNLRSEEDFWALSNVSFDVKSGEVLGIIGRNGAGKSTLLKILSRITEPTEGRIRIKGRIASLLEVGTGFHPELTGRENIYLNGGILGMRRVEIRAKFDEIVSFAGVEKFLDTPVKRYSSGMYVRLAFAVAAHLDPEILIIDEVLAVGDVEFQKKCLGKMQDVAQGGRTVLFVSHNFGAVRSLCSTACVVDHGRLSFQGTVDNALAHYLTKSNDAGEWALIKFQGTLAANFDLYSIAINGNRVTGSHFILSDATQVNLTFEYSFGSSMYVVCGLAVFSNGVRLFTLHDCKPSARSLAGARYQSSFELPPHTLRAGSFQIGFGAFEEGTSENWLWNDSVMDITIAANTSEMDLLAHGALSLCGAASRTLVS